MTFALAATGAFLETMALALTGAAATVFAATFVYFGATALVGDET